MKTLVDLCIKKIAACRKRFWTKNETPPHHLVFQGGGACSEAGRGEEIVACSHLADKLLLALSVRNCLDDAMLAWLAEKTELRTVFLEYNCKLSGRGLQALRSRSLSFFYLGSSTISMVDVLAALEGSRESLTVLRVDEVEWPPSRLADSLAQFVHLDSLSLQFCNMDDHLTPLMRRLPTLRQLSLTFLFIKGNAVDISPLHGCRDNLQTLVLQDCQLSWNCKTLNTLRSLWQLRHLDLSINTKSGWLACKKDTPRAFRTARFLRSCTVNPKLVVLNIAGRDAPSENVLRSYITSHKDLRLLNLTSNAASLYEMFREGSYIVDDTTTVKIVGNASVRQLQTTLEVYLARVQRDDRFSDHHYLFQHVFEGLDNRLSHDATRLQEEEFRQVCTELLEPIIQVMRTVDWALVHTMALLHLALVCWSICEGTQQLPFLARDRSTDLLVLVLKTLHRNILADLHGIRSKGQRKILEIARNIKRMPLPESLFPLRKVARQLKKTVLTVKQIEHGLRTRMV